MIIGKGSKINTQSLLCGKKNVIPQAIPNIFWEDVWTSPPKKKIPKKNQRTSGVTIDAWRSTISLLKRIRISVVPNISKKSPPHVTCHHEGLFSDVPRGIMVQVSSWSRICWFLPGHPGGFFIHLMLHQIWWPFRPQKMSTFYGSQLFLEFSQKKNGWTKTMKHVKPQAKLQVSSQHLLVVLGWFWCIQQFLLHPWSLHTWNMPRCSMYGIFTYILP